MIDPIKPCPFCGADAVRWADFVCCSKCPANNHITTWNMRATTHAPPPPNTMRVRVAVSVSADGSWSAIGGSAWESLSELSGVHMVGEGSWLDNSDAHRLSWIVAHVPKPDPAAEVEAEIDNS